MEKTLYAWLRNIGETVAGSTRAVIVTGPQAPESAKHTLHWPKNASDLDALIRMAKSALLQKQTVCLSACIFFIS